MCTCPRSRCHRNGDNLSPGLFSVDNLVFMPELSTALFCSACAAIFLVKTASSPYLASAYSY